MLRCVVTFLLIAKKSSNYLDRLVVTTDEVDKPSYGIYEVKSPHLLPHSQYIDRFMFDLREITKPGTYYIPYCSNYLKSAKIVSLITEGLTEITHQAHIPLTPDAGTEKNCLNYLSSMSNLEQEYNKIDILKCSKKLREICTRNIILNLAFKGIIAVDGQYKAFAPKRADQPIMVTHDQSMEIKSLFLNGEMFGARLTGNELNALAWYQGYLHMFKQNLTTSEWSPVTLIGSEMMSGSLITNHILEALPKSMLQWRKFYDFKKESLKNYNRREFGKEPYYEVYDPEIYLFTITYEKSYKKFVRNYPFFDLNYRRHIPGIHKYFPKLLADKLSILRHLLQWSEVFSYEKLITFQPTGTTSSSKDKVTTKSLKSCFMERFRKCIFSRSYL